MRKLSIGTNSMTCPRAVAALVGTSALLVVLAAPVQASPGALCSWYTKIPDANSGDNVLFSDSSATYWETSLVAAPATRVVVRGVFPFARYMSITDYDAAANTVASLSNAQIDPDRGSTNPFRTIGASSDPAHRRYTITIVFAAAPPNPAPNTLYAGQSKDGLPNPYSTLIYRVYAPDDPSSEQGGVGLPDVTYETPAGAQRLSQCDSLPPSTGEPVNNQVSAIEHSENFPAAVPRGIPGGPLYTNPPRTQRPAGYLSEWGSLPSNPVTPGSPPVNTVWDNAEAGYLQTFLSRSYGDVVAYRFKAPTFPNTEAGHSPALRRQVQYWSICEYEFATQRLIQCSADYQTNVGADGIARFVISDPANRPTGSDFNWLPWGGIYYDGFIMYRQLLPAYTQSIFAVTPGSTDGTAGMGPYWPQVAYCTTDTIERQGFDACFK